MLPPGHLPPGKYLAGATGTMAPSLSEQYIFKNNCRHANDVINRFASRKNRSCNRTESARTGLVAEEKERARVQEAKAQAIQEIREQETKLLTIEKEQHNVLKSAQVLICDSESKLADAIKHGDMDQVSVAHGLLEIARKRTATATTELRVVAQKRQKCADKLKLQTDTASQIATDKKPKRH